jgi:hypothetical protein
LAMLTMLIVSFWRGLHYLLQRLAAHYMPFVQTSTTFHLWIFINVNLLHVAPCHPCFYSQHAKSWNLLKLMIHISFASVGSTGNV